MRVDLPISVLEDETFRQNYLKDVQQHNRRIYVHREPNGKEYFTIVGRFDWRRVFWFFNWIVERCRSKPQFSWYNKLSITELKKGEIALNDSVLQKPFETARAVGNATLAKIPQNEKPPSITLIQPWDKQVRSWTQQSQFLFTIIDQKLSEMQLKSALDSDDLNQIQEWQKQLPVWIDLAEHYEGCEELKIKLEGLNGGLQNIRNRVGDLPHLLSMAIGQASQIRQEYIPPSYGEEDTRPPEIVEFFEKVYQIELAEVIYIPPQPDYSSLE